MATSALSEALRLPANRGVESSTYVHRRLAEIEAENEILRQRVHALETALGVLNRVPWQFRLSRSETKVFGALMRWPICTKEAIEAALYGNEKRTSLYAVLKTLRRKLKVHDIAIEAVYGQGWGLSVAAKKEFKP